MKSNLVLEKIKETVMAEYNDAKVVLFGSRARGTESKESDWDILILLNKQTVSLKDEQSIRHKIYDIELETEESISTFVFPINDWNIKLSVTPLFANVLKEGIYL